MRPCAELLFATLLQVSHQLLLLLSCLTIAHVSGHRVGCLLCAHPSSQKQEVSCECNCANQCDSEGEDVHEHSCDPHACHKALHLFWLMHKCGNASDCQCKPRLPWQTQLAVLAGLLDYYMGYLFWSLLQTFNSAAPVCHSKVCLLWQS